MFELRLLCPEECAESVEMALEALDALSVSVEDADAGTPAEMALFGEPGMPVPKEAWLHSRISALFPSEAEARNAARILNAQDFFVGCTLAGVVAIPDEDWVRATQSQFAPVEITPHFWIVPSWHEPPRAAQTWIRLDPGLAFGTGTHPTTRMCLKWIASHAPAPEMGAVGRVLDYGCGSGILAIGAALHGAQRVDAVDIDPAAIESTRGNAAANSVQLTEIGTPDVATGKYQWVLANILATPLKVLAPLLSSYVAPGGRLVMAGILARQEEELRSAYAEFCSLNVSDSEDGWVLMTASF